MINCLNLAATFQKLYEDSAEPSSAFLKLEIAVGNIFQIDSSMLQKLCKELKDGVGLTECGRTEDVLPYGISRDATFENGCLAAIIEIPKGLNLRRHSYASTDDFIKAFDNGIVRHFSIGLVDVICECNACHKSLSSKYEECCEHSLGLKVADNGKGTTYKIKEGIALFISAEPFPVTEDGNIQLLLEDWELDKATLMAAKISALSQAGMSVPSSALTFSRSHPRNRIRTRKL